MVDTASNIRGDFPTPIPDDQTLSWGVGNGELTISDGNTVDLDGRYLTGETDGSVTNELQDLDQLSLNGTTLEISLEQDPTVNTVDLASLQDGTGTDDQTLSIDSSGQRFDITIEGGNTISFTDDDDDDNAVHYDTGNEFAGISQKLSPSNADRILIEDSGASFGKKWIRVDSLPSGGGGTDDQNITGSSFNTGNGELTIGIENGSSQNVDLDGRYLTGETDGSVTNELQDLDQLSLNGTTLEISLEQDPTVNTVDLASLQDGTGTDDQNITGSSFNTGNGELTIGIENGSSQNVDLDGRYLTGETDGSVTNELQDLDQLSLNGTTLEISLEQDPTVNTVDLASLQDGTGTDDQNMVFNLDSLLIENGTGYGWNLVGIVLADHITANEQRAFDILNDALVVQGPGLALSIEDPANPTDDHYIEISAADESATNELQDFDITNLNGTTLELSLTDDPTTHTVDLSSLASGGGGGGDVYQGTTLTAGFIPKMQNDSLITNSVMSESGSKVTAPEFRATGLLEAYSTASNSVIMDPQLTTKLDLNSSSTGVMASFATSASTGTVRISNSSDDYDLSPNTTGFRISNGATNYIEFGNNGHTSFGGSNAVRPYQFTDTVRFSSIVEDSDGDVGKHIKGYEFQS